MNPVCYFCGAVLRKTVKSGGTFRICGKCGLISLSKGDRPHDAKNHYSAIYYPEEFSGRTGLERAFSYRLEALLKLLRKNSSVLEVGSASGDFLKILETLGHRVFGVEISERAVACAREKYGLDIFCGALDEASFEDEKFDAVLMYHVIEHVEDPRALLCEARRVLKPGGLLLVETPNPRSIDALASSKLLGSILDYPNHTHIFPPRVLLALFEEAGFRVILTESSFSFFVSSVARKIWNMVKNGGITTQTSRDSKTIEPEVQKWFAAASRGNATFLKKIAAKILPGMKFTAAALKEK